MIVVGTTMATYKTERPGDCLAWLASAEQMRHHAAGHELLFFAALEEDGRGRAPFAHVCQRLDVVHGTVWWFSLDTGAGRLHSDERLVHICEGRNLVTEYAMRTGAEWVLFLDSDMTVRGDCLAKLLELDHPIVGGDVPAYVLSGPEVDGFPFPVQEYWTTAGFLLVHSDLFRRLRWRVDLERGLTDDPCYAADALDLGHPTWVRKDVLGWHEGLVPVEQRGHDLDVHREPRTVNAP